MTRWALGLALFSALACGGGAPTAVTAEGAVDYALAAVEVGDRQQFLQGQSARIEAVRQVAASQRGTAPAGLEVELAADAERWRTRIVVRAPDAVDARGWCDAIAAALVADRAAERRRALEARRDALGERLTETTDPKVSVELRRELVDLSAGFERTDASVGAPCAVRTAQ